MLIVISSPAPLHTEASLINQLFDEGMPVFHLRKPEFTEKEYRKLLEQINSKYLNRTVLHNFHNIASEYVVKGIHGKNENAVSCSTHALDEFNGLNNNFKYAFLSPVFDSISKKNYKAKKFDLSKRTNFKTKLIALGGINETNCAKAYELGFDGVAMLGCIWNSEDKIKVLKKNQAQCPTTAQ